MKAIFMGTPEFALPSLEALIEKNIDIELVVTQPDRPKGRGKKMQASAVKQRAEELGIKVYQPDRIRSQESIDLIKTINPDLIVVVAFGQILPIEILKIPRYGCINVHASILPKYRGAAPINFSIINGEEKTGITTMYMDEGLDTGDIILIDEIEILDKDSASSLHDKLAILGKRTLINTIELLLSGSASRTKQNDMNASYSSIMTKEMGNINWTESAKLISNLIKGIDQWPSAYSYYKNEMIKFYDPIILSQKSDKYLPGQIISVSHEGLDIATSDYLIRIKQIQFSGKKRMFVKEFIKGNTIEIGSVLNTF